MSLVAIAPFSYAQNPLPIEISYDAAGNRITRKVLQVTMMAKGKNYSDSTYYIDQMQSVLMKVYPNPTQGKVYVEMQGGDEIGNSKIRLFDSHGRLIHEQEGDGDVVELDLSTYPLGYYIIDLFVNEEHTTWKIVKK